MSWKSWAAAIAAGMIGSWMFWGASAEANGFRTRLDGRGIEVVDQTNIPQSEREPGTSWPSQRPSSGSSLKEGGRIDSLGNVVPTHSNFPSTYAQEPAPSDMEASGRTTGAMGYRPVAPSDWHQSLAPFNIAN